jgi:hypothetical protein
MNVRSHYCPGHHAQKTHVRIICTNGYCYMPSFIGASFMSATDPAERNMYHASMLILFKPWGSWDNVMAWSTNFDKVFFDFMSTAPYHIQQYMHNTQLERESRMAAEAKNMHNQHKEYEQLDLPIHDSSLLDCDLDNVDINDFTPNVFQYSQRVCEYAQGAIQAGIRCGILNETSFTTTTPLANASAVPTSDEGTLAHWLLQMDEIVADQSSPSDYGIPSTSQNTSNVDKGHVLPNYNPEAAPLQSTFIPNITNHPQGPSVNFPDFGLNGQQQLIFNIVKTHLESVLAGSEPPQLLMKIMGAPGTGKSWVIEAITLLFQSLCV